MLLNIIIAALVILTGGLVQYTSLDGFPGITISQPTTNNDESVIAFDFGSINITSITFVNVTFFNESVK